jgi:hypothetical protein
MAGDVNINTQSLQQKAKPIMNSFRVIKGFSGKTSISALSKDLIMQFPVLMSAGVDVDDAVIIAKSLEKMYASMFLTVWTADANLRISEYGMNGVRDFVKKYHNNEDIPDVIMYGGDILGLTDTLLGLKGSGVTESTITIVDCRVTPTGNYVPATEMAKLWATVENELALESLNDMYLPAMGAQKKIAAITAALEADTTTPDTNTTSTDDAATGINATSDKSKTRTLPQRFADTAYRANSNSINPYTGRPGTGAGAKTNQGINKGTMVSTSTNSATIIRNDKLSSLEPTLIDVTFLVTGKGAGGIYTEDYEVDGTKKSRKVPVNVREQRAIVGLKTMIRLISSQYMIPNVISSIQDQSMAFKFVKWTKGEMKVGRDMLLGISRIKQDARATDQADMWFAALRKRKRSAKTFRFSNTGINPFATLVLTTDELEQIKAESGYDIMDRSTAKKLMDNLYLLGLVVVNTNTKIVHTLFDGFDNFSSTTIKALNVSSKESSDLDQFREIRKIMGRM